MLRPNDKWKYLLIYLLHDLIEMGFHNLIEIDGTTRLKLLIQTTGSRVLHVASWLMGLNSKKDHFVSSPK